MCQSLKIQNFFALVFIFFLTACSGGGGGSSGSGTQGTSTSTSTGADSNIVGQTNTTKSAIFNAYVVVGAGPINSTGYNAQLTFSGFDESKNAYVDCPNLNKTLTTKDNNIASIYGTCGDNVNKVYPTATITDPVDSTWLGNSGGCKTDSTSGTTTCSGFPIAPNDSVTTTSTYAGVLSKLTKGASFLKDTTTKSQVSAAYVLNISKTDSDLIAKNQLAIHANPNISASEKQAYDVNLMNTVSPLNTAANLVNAILNADSTAIQTAILSLNANITPSKKSELFGKINTGVASCSDDSCRLFSLNASIGDSTQPATAQVNTCSDINILESGIEQSSDTISISSSSNTALFYNDEDSCTHNSNPIADLSSLAITGGSLKIYTRNSIAETNNITINAKKVTIAAKLPPLTTTVNPTAVAHLSTPQLTIPPQQLLVMDSCELISIKVTPQDYYNNTLPNSQPTLSLPTLSGGLTANFYSDSACTKIMSQGDTTSPDPTDGSYNFYAKFTNYTTADILKNNPTLTVKTADGISSTPIALPKIYPALIFMRDNNNNNFLFQSPTISSSAIECTTLNFSIKQLTSSGMLQDLSDYSKLTNLSTSTTNTTNQTKFFSDSCITPLSANTNPFSKDPNALALATIHYKSSNNTDYTDSLVISFTYEGVKFSSDYVIDLNPQVSSQPLNFSFKSGPTLSASVSQKQIVGQCIPIHLSLINNSNAFHHITVTSDPKIIDNLSFYTPNDFTCSNPPIINGDFGNVSFINNSDLTVYVKSSTINTGTFTFAGDDLLTSNSSVTLNFVQPPVLAISKPSSVIQNQCAAINIRMLNSSSDSSINTSSQDTITISSQEDPNLKLYALLSDCNSSTKDLPSLTLQGGVSTVFVKSSLTDSSISNLSLIMHDINNFAVADISTSIPFQKPTTLSITSDTVGAGLEYDTCGGLLAKCTQINPDTNNPVVFTITLLDQNNNPIPNFNGLVNMSIVSAADGTQALNPAIFQSGMTLKSSCVTDPNSWWIDACSYRSSNNSFSFSITKYDDNLNPISTTNDGTFKFDNIGVSTINPGGNNCSQNGYTFQIQFSLDTTLYPNAQNPIFKVVQKC